MKSLAHEVADGEAVIINALRDLKEIESNKDLFCGLTERLLQLYPEDVNARFAVAYKYSHADQDELSLYHYLKIPHRERTAISWNNLGVQFDRFNLPCKSVDAYRTAENLGETLAMSNVARKFLNAGFVKEALEVCNRALQIENYHKNVGYTIQQIKQAQEDEDEKQKQPLSKATLLSEFYKQYGQAAMQEELLEHTGRWRGPDCELEIKIHSGAFSAEGEYETKRGGFAALLSPIETSHAPEADRYTIRYTGEMFGHSVRCGVVRKQVEKAIRFHSLFVRHDRADTDPHGRVKPRDGNTCL
jgi:hypothetical protein